VKRSKLWSILLLVLLLSSGILWGAVPASAGDPEKDSSSPYKKIEPPTLDQLMHALPDTMPLENELNPLSPYYGKDPLPPGPRPPGMSVILSPDQEFGTTIDYVSGSPSNPGAFGIHKIRPTMNTPEDPDEDTHIPLYAPTLMPPNQSALEATLYYWRPYGQSTLRKFAVYDHSIPGWIYSTPFDSQTFQDTYTSSGWVNVTVQYVSNKWRVWLYNYDLEEWEQKAESSGSSNFSNGWDMWEAIHDDYVSTYQSIEADDIRVWIDNDWEQVTDTYGGQWNTGMHPSWTKTWISEYYHWKVEP